METTLKQLLPPVIIIAVVIIFVAFFGSSFFKGQTEDFFKGTLGKATQAQQTAETQNNTWGQ